VLDFYRALYDKVLYYLSGSSFLIMLLPETVMIHNHGSGCELSVCKQVLSQFNWLGMGFVEFLDNGSIDTTHVCNYEVIRAHQINGNVG
jgi:hypothetical protein